MVPLDGSCSYEECRRVGHAGEPDGCPLEAMGHNLGHE